MVGFGLYVGGSVFGLYIWGVEGFKVASVGKHIDDLCMDGSYIPMRCVDLSQEKSVTIYLLVTIQVFQIHNLNIKILENINCSIS